MLRFKWSLQFLVLLAACAQSSGIQVPPPSVPPTRSLMSPAPPLTGPGPATTPYTATAQGVWPTTPNPARPTPARPSFRVTPNDRIPLRLARSPDEIAALARQDLAGRLGIPPAAIQVISVESAEWDDETLDVPRPPGHSPDRAYPGPTPGYRIVLAARGVQYEYRSGRTWLIFCGPA
jgi:hypothetical protein